MRFMYNAFFIGIFIFDERRIVFWIRRLEGSNGILYKGKVSVV